MGIHQTAKLRYMVVKTEGANPGTFALPATAERVIRLRNIEYSPSINFDNADGGYANSNHAEDEAIAGAQMITANCEVFVAKSGTVTTAPAWWTLAKACGCGVIGWSAGVACAEGTAVHGLGLVRREAYDDQTYSIVIVEKTIGSSPIYTLVKIAGAMGNMQLGVDAIGNIVRAKFQFTGLLEDIVDGADIALNAGTQTQLGEPFLSSAFTIGGAAEKISAFSLDLGNTISPVINQGGATGYSHFHITESKTRFSCNPLAVKQATKDWLASALAETSAAVVCPIGPAGTFTLNIPDAQVLSPAVAVREGLVGWNLNFKCLQNGVPGTPTDAGLTLEDTFELTHGKRTA